MSTRKVVYTDVEVLAQSEGGHTVTLDGKPLRTPARAPFVVPTDSLGQAIAGEWRAQQEHIRPESMPMTRLANSAIDKIPVQFDETVEALSAYAETDMTCFRADGPERLVARQSALWDPPLTWLRQNHGIALIQTVGVIAVDQPERAIGAFRDWLAAQTPFGLMALHDLIGMSGSIVLARALTENALSAEAAWEAAILDEMWNIELWGEDEEAAETRNAKRAEFAAAYRFWELLGEGKDG